MNFNEFSMYLFTSRLKRGGCTNACICIGTHSQPYYRTALWMFTKHGRHEMLMVPYKCCFFGQICPGADPGRGQNRSGGPLLQGTSASDWKATATNQMHSNDIEACGMLYCYFWFHSKVKFLTRFRHLLGLVVILPYFNAISVGFYAIKCLIYIYFV